jgi:hypothetical protein
MEFDPKNQFLLEYLTRNKKFRFHLPQLHLAFNSWEKILVSIALGWWPFGRHQHAAVVQYKKFNTGVLEMRRTAWKNM